MKKQTREPDTAPIRHVLRRIKTADGRDMIYYRDHGSYVTSVKTMIV